MNLKLFTAALLATGATAAWADNQDLSQDVGDQLNQNYQEMRERRFFVRNSILYLYCYNK